MSLVTTTVAPAPAAPAPQRGEAGPYFPLVAFAALLVGVVVMSADVLLGKSLLDKLVNGEEWQSYLIAGAFALASALGAIGAGSALRHRRRVWAGLFLAFWAIVGVALAVLRRFTYEIMDDPDSANRDLVVALVMLGVYLLAGLDVIYQSTKLSDQRYFALWRSGRQWRAAERRLAKLEPELERTDETLARLARDKDRLEAEVAEENGRLDALARELRAKARLRIAYHLGDPAATSLVGSEGRGPDPDAARPAAN
nr:hypothetical protein [Propionibacterium sp.]